MNSMFLVWTLSFLIVSYTLGFPIPNSTSSGFQMETFLNVTESNSTRYIKTNQTRPSSGMPFLGPSSGMPPPGFLILSHTLGFPVLNGTSNGSYISMVPNVTERNSTETNQTGQTVLRRLYDRLPGPRCIFPLCATQNLADRMQFGDEKAGDSASDAFGPGKK
ncbi:hypothetical protein Q8A67_012684 [Cirrhinus molitorella]|uniref:Uncharacterized protein n=1 Tax=Cirrhinus molitorella TaxID=172907 RepID=A0AA88TLH8_9TELE|nr:hypothetical protein Q8A67_012684 [Cirrhinus molitorella]